MPTTDEQATHGNSVAILESLLKRLKRLNRRMAVLSILSLLPLFVWFFIIKKYPTDPVFIPVKEEVESCSYVNARYSNCLLSLLSPGVCNDCVKDAAKQQKNQDRKSCDVFEDLFSSTCNQSCHKCEVAIENWVHCAMEEYDGCTIRSVPIPESATLQLPPNQSSSIINNTNNNYNNNNNTTTTTTTPSP